MENNFKILLLEDEVDINNLWTKSLKKEGYFVKNFFNGNDVINNLKLNHNYDLAILDIMVPGKNGLDVANFIHLNYPEIYIIILSLKEDHETISLGFNIGANEYLKKPCPLPELKIRIKQIYKNKSMDKNKLLGKVIVNDLDCSVKIHGKHYFLSNTEYKIFYLLLKENGNPIKKTIILESIWGIDINEDSRILELNIYNIRKKINKDIIKSGNSGYYIDHEII